MTPLPIETILLSPWRVVVKALTAIPHLRPRGVSFLLLNRTQRDYQAEIRDVMLNSAFGATVNWVTRVFPEAAVMVEHPEEETWVGDHQHPLALLVRRPNPFYSGAELWMATIIDLLVNGNAYWIKVHPDEEGRRPPGELWWAPASTMTPMAGREGSEENPFIAWYRYEPSGQQRRLEPESVVHFRWGIDPEDPRFGRSPTSSLLREVFTDDEAANFAAALVRNMGVPGMIVTPDGDVEMGEEDRKEAEERWNQKFGGDKRGSVLISSGKIKVEKVSFSPQELSFSDLRNIPEERITAVLGIPAAVVGLGSGLEQTKVGATMRELREMAYESAIVPLQRIVADQLTVQLLPDFEDVDTESRVAFDLRAVRVLQEDQDRLHTRIREDFRAGLLTRKQALEALGMEAEDKDDVYLLPINLLEVRRGEPIAALPSPAMQRDYPASAGMGRARGRAF